MVRYGGRNLYFLLIALSFFFSVKWNIVSLGEGDHGKGGLGNVQRKNYKLVPEERLDREI